MSKIRQAQKNGIGSESLDAFLSIDVDSFLADSSGTDFIFQDDATRSRSLKRVFSNKRLERALFVAASAVVLFALFLTPYLCRSYKPSNEIDVAETSSGNGENVPLEERSDDQAFWNYGSRICDSLTDRAIDSTCNFYGKTRLELSACRLCLAQIADKYSETTSPDEFFVGIDESVSAEENVEKKVDKKNGEKYTLDKGDVPTTSEQLENRRCAATELLYFDPMFRVVQEFYRQNREEKEQDVL